MKIYSVTEFNREMKDMMYEFKVTVQGEVSGFHVNQGRLVFFDLKDDSSAMPCFLLAFNLQTELKDGMEIRVTGNPSLFIKSGRFNFNVLEIELVGKGTLQQEFERLKKKLEDEGLFREERKRHIPRFPEKIGLITSLDAAAYTDVLRILNTRWSGLEIFVYPARVQGKEAIPDIVEAFRFFQTKENIEVIILTRGGGSLEDLQAFNSEEVARAVFSSRIPVVVGVGHERDVTLADFVADKRAATPTHAAELVVPHRDDVAYQINELVKHQRRIMENCIETKSVSTDETIMRLDHSVQNQMHRVEQASAAFIAGSSQWLQRMDYAHEKIELQKQQWERNLASNIMEQERQIDKYSKLLRSLNPVGILHRGYSVTYTIHRKVIRSIKDVKSGERITTKLCDGSIQSKTNNILL